MYDLRLGLIVKQVLDGINVDIVTAISRYGENPSTL